MSATLLTCAETPLAWPSGIKVEELPPQKTIGIRVIAPLPGPLTLEPRPARDGVTVNEASNIGADYRGQRYSIDEAVFHVPGLHVFPGQKSVYPAEYHIHFTTFTAPTRSLTLVIPVSHKVTGAGQDYFASLAATADPAATRPTLETLLKVGDDVLQYRGPDIRGRVGGDQPDKCDTDITKEMQFLLVQTPCQIRAADLERIPREGTTRGVIVANDTAEMPFPGIAAKARLTRDRIVRTVVLARPGILGPAVATPSPPLGPGGQSEYMCQPLEVVDGQDVIATGTGSYQPLSDVLGLSGSRGGVTGLGAMKGEGEDDAEGNKQKDNLAAWGRFARNFGIAFFCVIVARFFAGFFWIWVFSNIAIDPRGWGGNSVGLLTVEVLAMIAIAAAAAKGQDLVAQFL
jgi:hypothetical protein